MYVLQRYIRYEGGSSLLQHGTGTSSVMTRDLLLRSGKQKRMARSYYTTRVGSCRRRGSRQSAVADLEADLDQAARGLADELLGADDSFIVAVIGCVLLRL